MKRIRKITASKNILDITKLAWKTANKLQNGQKSHIGCIRACENNAGNKTQSSNKLKKAVQQNAKTLYTVTWKCSYYAGLFCCGSMTLKCILFSNLVYLHRSFIRILLTTLVELVEERFWTVLDAVKRFIYWLVQLN